MNVVGSGAARSSTFTAYRSSASFFRTTNQGVAGGAVGGGATFSAGGRGATRLDRFIVPLLSRRIATVPFCVESSPTVTVRLMRSMSVYLIDSEGILRKSSFSPFFFRRSPLRVAVRPDSWSGPSFSPAYR